MSRIRVVFGTLAKAVLPAPLSQRLSGSSIAKRLARGSLWSLAGSATSRLLVLVAMIGVARVLGKVSFGESGLIQATLGVAGLMAGLGLGGTATRFVAQYAAPDPDRAGRVIGMVMLISWGTVLLDHDGGAGALLWRAGGVAGVGGGVHSGLDGRAAVARRGSESARH